MKRFLSWWLGTSEDGNIGLLLLRVFVGAGLMTHGISKIMGGPEFWTGLGGIMAKIGVPGPAVFWGFMSALAESVGSLFLVLGALTRMASFLIVFNMSVASFVAHAGASFEVREKALLYLSAGLFFLLKGAGRYSVDRLLRRFF